MEKKNNNPFKKQNKFFSIFSKKKKPVVKIKDDKDEFKEEIVDQTKDTYYVKAEVVYCTPIVERNYIVNRIKHDDYNISIPKTESFYKEMYEYSIDYIRNNRVTYDNIVICIDIVTNPLMDTYKTVVRYIDEFISGWSNIKATKLKKATKVDISRTENNIISKETIKIIISGSIGDYNEYFDIYYDGINNIGKVITVALAASSEVYYSMLPSLEKFGYNTRSIFVDDDINLKLRASEFTATDEYSEDYKVTCTTDENTGNNIYLITDSNEKIIQNSVIDDYSLKRMYIICNQHLYSGDNDIISETIIMDIYKYYRIKHFLDNKSMYYGGELDNYRSLNPIPFEMPEFINIYMEKNFPNPGIKFTKLGAMEEDTYDNVDEVINEINLFEEE